MKKGYAEIFLNGELFLLLPQRGLYRPDKNQLIISDVHLGKASHFRKQGIPFPAQSHLKDLDKLHYLLNSWQPSSVLILGDLFHSSYNREWLWFKSLLMNYPNTLFTLVEGNHDILDQSYYSLPNLVAINVLEEEYFIFSHHQLKNVNKLNICGHIHPGIELSATGRQWMRFPCFYSGVNHFILPAFGQLTGLHILKREVNSEYYIIVEDAVIKI